MLISVSYYLGDYPKYKYFDTLEELNKFVEDFLKVFTRQSEYLEISFFIEKEEERVRKIIKQKEKEK